jgi:hypothetical protein
MSGPMVPAGPVRIHVQSLLDQGMRPVTIYKAAKTTSAALSALIYGQFQPGRPPQQTIGAETAARLLAVEYEPPQAASPALCAPGTRFEPIGYRVGRCGNCGQFAPLHTRDGAAAMMSHPRPVTNTQEPDELPGPAGAGHPDCGTPRGRQRHRREHTEPCEPCKAARRAWEQGYEAGLTKARRTAAQTVPAPLIAESVKAMRAVLYRQPYPQLRELARKVVGIAADAEFAIDDVAGAADAEAA